MTSVRDRASCMQREGERQYAQFSRPDACKVRVGSHAAFARNGPTRPTVTFGAAGSSVAAGPSGCFWGAGLSSKSEEWKLGDELVEQPSEAPPSSSAWCFVLPQHQGLVSRVSGLRVHPRGDL